MKFVRLQSACRKQVWRWEIDRSMNCRNLAKKLWLFHLLCICYEKVKLQLLQLKTKVTKFSRKWWHHYFSHFEESSHHVCFSTSAETHKTLLSKLFRANAILSTRSFCFSSTIFPLPFEDIMQKWSKINSPLASFKSFETWLASMYCF